MNLNASYILNDDINVSVTGSYVGYSSEDKAIIAPNPKRGSDFVELDTKMIYIYDGAGWVLF